MFKKHPATGTKQGHKSNQKHMLHLYNSTNMKNTKQNTHTSSIAKRYEQAKPNKRPEEINNNKDKKRPPASELNTPKI